MPAGFSAVSVTFASVAEGWVLGDAPCAQGRCAFILHTLDGGQTWSRTAASPFPVHPLDPVSGAPAGVSELRFADPLDGFAYGPDLWATHNGGQSWTLVRLPNLIQPSVVALEAAHGTVQAVLADGQGTYRIASSPIGSDHWTLAPIRLPFGAGRRPAVQLVLAGATGWVVQNDRTVVDGARLVAGIWRSWQPVCAGLGGPDVLAASSGTDLVGACDVGAAGSPPAEHVYLSSDGGLAAHEAGAAMPAEQVTGIASPDPATVIVAGATARGAVLVGTFDGGRVWTTVLGPTQSTFSDLGFVSASEGYAIVSGGLLILTRDGGRAWVPVTFTTAPGPFPA